MADRSEQPSKVSYDYDPARYARAKLDIDEPGQPVADPEREPTADPLYYLV